MDQIGLTYNLIHYGGILYFLLLILISLLCMRKMRLRNNEYYSGFMISMILFTGSFILFEIINIFHL